MRNTLRSLFSLTNHTLRDDQISVQIFQGIHKFEPWQIFHSQTSLKTIVCKQFQTNKAKYFSSIELWIFGMDCPRTLITQAQLKRGEYSLFLSTLFFHMREYRDIAVFPFCFTEWWSRWTRSRWSGNRCRSGGSAARGQPSTPRTTPRVRNAAAPTRVSATDTTNFRWVIKDCHTSFVSWWLPVLILHNYFENVCNLMIKGWQATQLCATLMYLIGPLIYTHPCNLMLWTIILHIAFFIESWEVRHSIRGHFLHSLS